MPLVAGALIPPSYAAISELVRAGEIEPPVSAFAMQYPARLDDARVKVAAGAGLEPTSPGSEPGILATERTGCGWKQVTRTPKAGMVTEILAAVRTLPLRGDCYPPCRAAGKLG